MQSELKDQHSKLTKCTKKRKLFFLKKQLEDILMASWSKEYKKEVEEKYMLKRWRLVHCKMNVKYLIFAIRAL